MSIEDNCSLSSGHPWSTAVQCLLSLFSWPYTFLYLIFFLWIVMFLFVPLAWIDRSGFELLPLLTIPCFKKFKSNILIDAELSRTDSLCVEQSTVRLWPPTLYSWSLSSHSSCYGFAEAIVTGEKWNIWNSCLAIFIYYLLFIWCLSDRACFANSVATVQN